MNTERYQVTVFRDGRPAVRGWWGNRETAGRKFSSWIGAHARAGARIVVTDEADGGRVIHSWPDEP